MGIDYLLFLQNFREEVLQGQLNIFFENFSNLVITPYPVLFFALVYWLINKQDGMFYFMNCGIARLVNDVIKLCACVYRPWILDSRIEPANSLKILATGYSFPSGHSCMAVSIAGSLGRMLVKISKIFIFICAIFVALIGFTRNFLGVHTLQDVFVGIIASSIVFIFCIKIYDKVYNCSKKYDWILLISCLGLGLIVFLFYTFKPYPYDYIDGNLLVDPVKMIPDTNEANAMFCTFWIAWFIERRFINFRTFRNKKIGLLISIICMIPLYFWHSNFIAFSVQYLDKNICNYIHIFVEFMYVLNVIPLLINFVNSKYPSRSIKK